MILSGNFHQFSWKPQYKGFFHPQNPRKRTISPAYFWRHPPPNFYVISYTFFMIGVLTSFPETPLFQLLCEHCFLKKWKKFVCFQSRPHLPIYHQAIIYLFVPWHETTPSCVVFLLLWSVDYQSLSLVSKTMASLRPSINKKSGSLSATFLNWFSYLEMPVSLHWQIVCLTRDTVCYNRGCFKL